MKEKLLWADNLRAFATLAVILLHTAAPILYQYGSIPNSYWWIGNLVDGTVRFCVPIFLMLTGALLYSKTYSLSEFFKKRFTRILLPFLFWSLVYIVHGLIRKWCHGADAITVSEVANTFYNKLMHGASLHLWYIYMLIGIYMIFPIIQKWIVNSSNKEILYYLAIWVLVAVLNFPFINTIKPNIDVRYFSGYLGYTIVGYFLAQRITYNKKLLPLLLTLVGILATIVGSYFLTLSKGKFQEDLYLYLSPTVAITSIGVFLLFKNITITNNLLQKIIHLISKYSFGIYLSHILIMFYLSESGINWTYIHPLIGIPITTVTTLLIALAITFAINKIPYGKHISG